MPRSLVLTGDEMAAMARLGRRLRLARLRRNLSQAAAAERCGLARSTYIDLEAGKPGVSIGALVKILAVLGYPERIATLMESDPVGEDLEQVYGRKRAGGHRDLEDF